MGSSNFLPKMKMRNMAQSENRSKKYFLGPTCPRIYSRDIEDRTGGMAMEIPRHPHFIPLQWR
jgi:hypothetical protein